MLLPYISAGGIDFENFCGLYSEKTEWVYDLLTGMSITPYQLQCL